MNVLGFGNVDHPIYPKLIFKRTEDVAPKLLSRGIVTHWKRILQRYFILY